MVIMIHMVDDNPGLHSGVYLQKEVLSRLKQYVYNRRINIVIGTALAIGGIGWMLYSIHSYVGVGPPHISYFWSFKPVGSSQWPPGIPVPGTALDTEILVPWLIIGVLLLLSAIYLFFGKHVLSTIARN